MNPNGHDPEKSPVQYPRVTIQGVSYSVKWSNSAMYRLDAMGVDLSAVGKALSSGRIGLKILFDLLAACIEKKPRFDPEELCDLVPKEDFKLMAQALLESMGKAQPPAEVKLQEPAAEAKQLQ